MSKLQKDYSSIITNLSCMVCKTIQLMTT